MVPSNPTMKFSPRDQQNWLHAVTTQPRSHVGLMDWVNGPLKNFFPFTRVLLGYGEQVAGQIHITHWMAQGHEELSVRGIATTFDLETRGSLNWWLSHRLPFYIDPLCPPSFATAFELDEMRAAGLGRIAAHGVINAKANAGTYFSFAGIPDELSDWHLDALTLIAPVLNGLFLSHVAAQHTHLRSALLTLTARQKDIVRRIAIGLDDKALARILGIAEKTVRNQLTEIYNQTGVRKRTQLMALLR